MNGGDRPQRLLNWGAVIVAAGRGTRFGRPKQLIEIAGAPMLSWSIRIFASMHEISDIIVVTEREWLEDVAAVATQCAVVPGGATRQASVFEGVRSLPARCNAVLVHDGARPLITVEDVRRGMEPVCDCHASLLGVPVVDTIKVVDVSTRVIERTLDRNVLWAAQTPQFATLPDMLRAHEAGVRDGIDATDDAMLLEHIGVHVHMVYGSPENFKVTLPEDHERAQHVMRERVTAQQEVR
jgi:2-C-methyl-D-erythritol 4-phosphate cytidylyltransferase